PVIASCDPAEVHEPAEGVLDAMAPFVCLLVEAEGKLSVGFVRDDGRGSAPMEPAAQGRTVVSAIAEQRLGRSGTSDQSLRRRAIVRLSAGQKEGKKTALSICDCVDFRVAPAARASNSLLVLPLFAPEAERWALTCVASIICTAVARPRLASARNNRSHTPRSSQRTNRVYIVFAGPYSGGQSHHRQPLLMTNTMPLITRRSSTRALPRTSIGRSGCIEHHCSSLSQKRLDRIARPRSESTPRANQQLIQTTTVLLGPHPSLCGFPLVLQASFVDCAFGRREDRHAGSCSRGQLPSDCSARAQEQLQHWLRPQNSPLRACAVVSRGGRPDLARDTLDEVYAPTLLIVVALISMSFSSTSTPWPACAVPRRCKSCPGRAIVG